MPADWSWETTGRTPPDCPHGVEPLFGANPHWSPSTELAGAAKCDRCGGSIQRGSRLYCCACSRSGLDHIYYMPRVAPPKVATPRKAGIEIRLTRKQLVYLSLRYGDDAAKWLKEQGYEVEIKP